MKKFFLSIWMLFSVMALAFAADNDKLSQKEIKLIIDTLSTLIEQEYVFADVGKEISDQLNQNLAEGKYAGITDYQEFSDVMTSDLRSKNGDKHLALIYAPDVIKSIRESEKNKNDSLENEILGVRQRRNFGFSKIEILDGNIGYLRLDNFYDVNQAGETAIAAMQFLAHTGAIILDLRYNGGGNGNMIQLLTSYFFGNETQHLNTSYSRKEDFYYQSWSMPWVPGKRLENTELFILTSKNTFSAAEEFCYDLQNLGRATIIGESTGGGAHPVTRTVLNENFGAQLAIGQAINPITKTNWEGVGVQPDILINADQAKDMAYKEALKKLVTKDYPPNFHERLEYLLKKLETEI